MTRAPLCLVLCVGIAALGASVVAPNAASQRAPRAPRSELVYPVQHLALRMDHAHPAHRELACTRCHASAEASTQASDFLFPAEAQCAPCHDAQLDRAHPTTEACGTCHQGFGIEGARAVPESIVPTARLRFSHQTHASRGIACTTCHDGVRDAAQATREHLPTMASCLRCHSEDAQAHGVSASIAPTEAARAPAPTRCQTCHLTLPDGRLRTHFPEGWMNPPETLAGMHHDADWIVRHRWVGADQGPACATCHTERDCADCHDGRVRPRRIHPNDWLTIHPQMARRDETRCSTCHNAQTFCAECHARLGLATFSAPSVARASRYHPPREVWTQGPAQHGLEARRALGTCITCHAERDCVACHGASGVGGLGLSPHPPGFAAQCRSALSANARACATCHGDLDALAARCR